jgi:hypothetical protein
MALGENQNKIQYVVTTSDDTFNFPYKYWDSSEIFVTQLKDGVETSPAFTITATNGNPENGGLVILSTPADNCTITIERVIPIKSEANYTPGALSPASLTEGFDRAAAMSQQLEDRLDRVPVHPVTDPDGLSYEAPTVEQRAGKASGWDESGNVVGLNLSDSGTIAGNAAAGIDVTNNIVSAKVDGTSCAFVGGDIAVKDAGITPAKIATSAVETAKIAPESVTLAKMEKRSDNTLLGNVSGVSATPSEVGIIVDGELTGASDDNIPSALAVKTHVATVSSGLMQYSGATVFTGAMPISYTDLNLSGTVGPNRCFVHLSIESDAGGNVAFRPNGETKPSWAGSNVPSGTSMSAVTASTIHYLSVITDEAGIVEWDADVSGSGGTVIKLLAYQILQV